MAVSWLCPVLNQILNKVIKILDLRILLLRWKDTFSGKEFVIIIVASILKGAEFSMTFQL